MSRNRRLLEEVKDIQSVFDRVKNGETQITLSGLSISTKRLRCFAFKGHRCVSCGAIGEVLRLEEQLNGGGIHFDLYAKTRNGGLNLMTIDHIKPKSRGGLNTLSNYQTMCTSCNRDKGDKIWYTFSKKDSLLQNPS